MGLEDLLIDSNQDFFLWNSECNLGKVATHSEINLEGSALRVHARQEHDINEVHLLLKCTTIIDKAVVDDLTNQGA